MRTAYRILALLLAAEAVVQSVAVGYFVGALYRWIVTGGAVGVADHSAMRALPDESPVAALDRMVLASAERWMAGGVGLTIHTITEVWLAPVLAVLLVAVAYLSRVGGSVASAIPVACAVALQWLTGLAAGSVPAAAAVHELAAFAVFVAALRAAGLLRRPVGVAEEVRRAGVRRAYLGLAGLVAAGLLVEAMALAAAVTGVAEYVAHGHAEVYDTMLGRPEEWNEAGIGYLVHVLLGVVVLPLLATLLLVVAPLTATQGGVRRASVVLVAVLARGALTIIGELSPWAAAGFQLAGYAVLAAALAAAVWMAARIQAAPAVPEAASALARE